MNSTGSSGFTPSGITGLLVCRSLHCSGPWTLLRMRTTRFFDLSTRTSMKLWKKGARLKSKMPENASTLNGQALNHFIQYQNGCFHIGIHLGAKVVGPRVERPVRCSRLLRKVEGRADAEVGAAAAIDEVVHHSRGAVTGDVFPVIFKVVRIAGHGDLDVVGRQELIERSELFGRFGDILAFGNRRNVVAASETWMADDGHGEFTPTSIDGSSQPHPLSFL